jgi:hypothetical protein
MTSLKIVLLVLFSTIAYGILHDTITANLCVEYFTIGHPKVIASESPFMLALVWGIIATWWLALPIAILMAVVSQTGKAPKLSLKEVSKTVFRLLGIMALLALVAGITGYLLAESGAIWLVPELAEQIDAQAHSRFLAAGWSHGASYLSGIIGTLIVCILLYRKRKAQV